MRAQEENLTGSLILSTCMHAGGMFLLIFGLPVFSRPLPLAPGWRPVPIDIVEIGAITNTRLRGDEGVTAKTSPPVSASQPEHEAPKPAQKPSAPAQAEPSVEEVVLPVPGEKPKEIKENKEEKKEKEKSKEAADPLASVLKNLASLKSAAPPIDDARVDDKRNDGDSQEGTAKGFGPALGDRLTISQEDALRRQIGQCWNMPIGARNAEELIVEVLIEMNEDRTVRSAEVADRARLATDPHFRAAAEAALRALRHPKCTPLLLPEGQYEQWKRIRFNFDPRDML